MNRAGWYRRHRAAGRLSGYAGSCINHTAERRIPLSGPYSVPGSVSGNAEAERGRELSEEDSEEVRASSARCACVVSTRRNSRPAPSVTSVISPARSPAASRRYVSVRHPGKHPVRRQRRWQYVLSTRHPLRPPQYPPRPLCAVGRQVKMRA
ncbi:Uncharacterised protein [Shigella sonnei]|nr:Uncharacterised protein [Shigella sonnei]